MNGLTVAAISITAIIGLVYWADQDAKQWQAYKQAELNRCLKTPHETLYSCAAYINSLQAKRDANNAESVAITSMTFSTINAANSGGKR